MNNMEFKIPTLIEDLGMLYPTETSNYKKRFGIYECGFCGTHFKARNNDVKVGSIKSCGCYQKRQRTKHGGSHSKLYNIWRGIKARTTNKAKSQYPDYGGRGITMCDEWFNDFIPFRDWALANGYIEEDKGLSIDRIDNDGNYEPSNCRWTTQNIQVRNQRMKGSNTSGYRGVSFNNRDNSFRAQISINSKKIHIGTFKTAVEGAIVYNNYIIENNLEGFILNIIPDEFKGFIPQNLTRKKKENT